MSRRHESDREDLIREAVAYPRRLEWIDPNQSTVVFAGIGRDGRLSIYVDADPVYHFDADDRLRRAFVDGKLYRTTGDTLAELNRERDETSTVLQRRDLTPEETQAFLEQARLRLVEVGDAIEAGELTIDRRIPEDDAALEAELIARLRAIANSPIPLAPAIAGKR